MRMKDQKNPPLKVSRPINKRPGRCVCICTAKGKIVYIEDRFEYNKQNQRR